MDKLDEFIAKGREELKNRIQNNNDDRASFTVRIKNLEKRIEVLEDSNEELIEKLEEIDSNSTNA